jgi:hypothetical protein
MTDAVIDFVEKRNEAIEQRRREFERIMFKNFLGVYSILDDQVKAYAVDLIDISDKGCLIQIPMDKETEKRYKKDMEVNLRIYFTPHAFIPLNVSIKYSTEYLEADGTQYLRYGCEFDKSAVSFEAMESFIRFIYKFAEHSCSDRHEARQSNG